MTDKGSGGPGDKVREAMAGKKPPPKLNVIDGGKDEGGRLGAGTKGAGGQSANASDRPKRRRPRKSEGTPPAESAFELYGADASDREAPPDVAYDGEDGPPADVGAEELEGARVCSVLDQNDRDNGRRLIYWFGRDMGYVPGMGWLVFRETHWTRDEGELDVARFAQAIVDKIKLEAAVLEHTPGAVRLLAAAEKAEKKPEADRSAADVKLVRAAEGVRKLLGERRSKRRSFAITSGNRGRTVAMLAQAASMRAVDPKLLDADPMKFNVRNGTLSFSLILDPERPEGSDRMTGEVAFSAEHDRADMITRVADVVYDPEADCPKWRAFLEAVHPADTQMQTFLQVAHAYALLVSGNNEQIVLFHYGQGANGKSVFIETLGRLAGGYRAVVAPETFTGDQQKQGQQASPDIARLFNTRLVTVEELPRGVALKENVIKAASGGTRLVARFLQKEFFEFDPIFTTVMSGNDMPQVSGTDYGIWRRLKIVHWAVTIPEEKRRPFGEMLAELDAERSGILNWLIEGLMLYLANGLAPYIPAAVKAFTEDYREERDHVGQFVESCVLKVEGKTVQAKDMYDAYCSWCGANGLKPYQQTGFGSRMNALGITKTRGRVYVYQNVMLGDVPAAPRRMDNSVPPPAPPPDDPGWEPDPRI